MKTVPFGSTEQHVPAIAVGCMRMSRFAPAEMAHYLHTCLDLGLRFFDHADIYGQGASEAAFGAALKYDPSLRRESMWIQSKCGIVSGVMYDSSREHIIEAAEGSLKRLGIEQLDSLLIHRPDALVEPEEVAEAFEHLHKEGKVRWFGVSNHKPAQIALLKKYIPQGIQADQLQFALPVSNMIANGMEVNMESPGSVDHDDSVLDWCRLNDVTIQAWSPFQLPAWKGPFIGSDACPELNKTLAEIAQAHKSTPTAIAAAWILRHPANMQLIAGTTSEDRLREIASACEIKLSRTEWYRLYLSAGHPLP